MVRVQHLGHIKRNIAHAERAAELLKTAAWAWLDDDSCRAPDEEAFPLDDEAAASLERLRAMRVETEEMLRVLNRARSEKRKVLEETAALAKEEGLLGDPQAYVDEMHSGPGPFRKATGKRRYYRDQQELHKDDWFDFSDLETDTETGPLLPASCDAAAQRREGLARALLSTAVRQTVRDLAFAYREMKRELSKWEDPPDAIVKRLASLDRKVAFWQDWDETRDKVTQTEKRVYAAFDMITGLMGVAGSALALPGWGSRFVERQTSGSRGASSRRLRRSRRRVAKAVAATSAFMSSASEIPAVATTVWGISTLLALKETALQSIGAKQFGQRPVTPVTPERPVPPVTNDMEVKYGMEFYKLVLPPPETKDLHPLNELDSVTKTKALGQEALAYSTRLQKQIDQVAGAAEYACCFGEEVARWHATKHQVQKSHGKGNMWGSSCAATPRARLSLAPCRASATSRCQWSGDGGRQSRHYQQARQAHRAQSRRSIPWRHGAVPSRGVDCQPSEGDADVGEVDHFGHVEHETPSI